MSAISGIINLASASDFSEACLKMSEVCCRRKKNSDINIYKSSKAFFSAFSNENMPLTMNLNGIKYTIMYDGEIYNIDEIKAYISSKYHLSGNETDSELILLLYHLCGNAFLKRINGVFAIAVWNESSSELMLARDRLGIKPLYYTIIDKTLIFSSEIKGILFSGLVSAELTIDGIYHIFGIGPNIEQGYGILKNIFELIPSTVASFNEYGFKTYKYWSLNSAVHTDTLEETIEKVYQLTNSSVKRQITKNNGKLCCFLSGGLDSSIITSIAAKELSDINTFSIEYTGNNEFFKPNEYQPDSDIAYIKCISEIFGTKHNVIEVSTEALKKFLTDAVIARDHPGMGDIDSSLYFFCNTVSENFDIAMSGECADEVFGGYPWFHRKEDFNAQTFPWSKNVDLRMQIINKENICQSNLKKYIDKKYLSSVSETPTLSADNSEEKRRREISYLNLKWFMYSLGERSERIGMSNGLNIRMPFADYKLIEYVWNIPWEFKAYAGREKGLLRKCFASDLPEEIVFRKKSPFPKTHNPNFEKAVKAELKEILLCDERKIFTLVNKEEILNLTEKESDYSKPWFGQLMALPQLYAYLIQIDFWLEHYNIKISL